MTSASSPDQQQLLGRIADTVSALKLVEFPAWRELGDLSLNTHQDAIEVDPDTIHLSGKTFSGPMNVYVMLDYEEGGKSSTLAEGFPGSFRGHLGHNDEVVIEKVQVDTGDFLRE